MPDNDHWSLRLARASPTTIPDLKTPKISQTRLLNYSSREATKQISKWVLFKTHSSLSVANFLTGFDKSKVCMPQNTGRHLPRFCKKYTLRFRCFCGINRCAFYSTVNEIFFTKTLLLPNPFQGRVATIRTNEAYAELIKSSKNKSYANTTTFSTYAAFMEDSALQKNKPFKIPCFSMGNLSAGRHYGLLSG